MKNKKETENWEKALKKMASENCPIWDACIEKCVINFIRQLLAQERHDHEILVNTILDTKNDEIKRAKSFGNPKKQEYEECQHNWIWYPDETSTLKFAGYWICNKCGGWKK